MTEEIRVLFETAGVALSDDDWSFFERVRQATIRANEQMNLTRLTEPLDFYRKHVLDSALPFFKVPELAELEGPGMAADVGSGSGFPGLVLARLRPAWEVALLERTQKKAGFLEDLRETLALENVYVVPLDARDVPGRVPALRDGCDLVLARAVGRIGAVTQAAAELLKPGGLLVHFKGGEPDADELAEGKVIAKRNRLKQRAPIAYDLPPDARRSVVISLSRRRTRGA